MGSILFVSITYFRTKVTEESIDYPVVYGLLPGLDVAECVGLGRGSHTSPVRYSVELLRKFKMKFRT